MSDIDVAHVRFEAGSFVLVRGPIATVLFDDSAASPESVAALMAASTDTDYSALNELLLRCAEDSQFGRFAAVLNAPHAWDLIATGALVISVTTEAADLQVEEGRNGLQTSVRRRPECFDAPRRYSGAAISRGQ